MTERTDITRRTLVGDTNRAWHAPHRITQLLPGGAVDILNLHRKWGGYWGGPGFAWIDNYGLDLYFHGSEQEMRDTDDLPARLQAWLDSCAAALCPL